MTEVVLPEGRSLAQLAEESQVSGWQGLYYSNANHRLRQAYPDPWTLPAGSVCALPDTSDQEVTLLDRVRFLDGQQRSVMRVAGAVKALLGSDLAQRALSGVDQSLAAFLRSLGTESLAAIAILKAADTPYSRVDAALAGDAMGRLSLETSQERATVLSLLARASRGVPWAIPGSAARGWCDVGSPNYWGKTFLPMWLEAGVVPSRVGLRSGLQRAHEVAVTSVTREIAMLRTGALMELNGLRRRIEAGHA